VNVITAIPIGGRGGHLLRLNLSQIEDTPLFERHLCRLTSLG